ncbi:MAG: energy transducer TonB [Acidobacteria bacterium]|nr:energy transducer TonB [Acidobacteriota bacterium]
MQGKVELVASVSKNGKVVDISVMSGHNLLSGPARTTLAQWRFSGCTATNEVCKVNVVFVFTLEGQCDLPRCGTEFSADLPHSVRIKTKAARPVVD